MDISTVATVGLYVWGAWVLSSLVVYCDFDTGGVL